MPDSPVLLFDARCALCSGAVRFVLRHERRRTLRFATLDSAFARSVVGRHPELHGVDSVVWYQPDAQGSARVAIRSAAVLRVAAYLGGPWRLLGAGRIVPRSWRDRLYDFVSRHRHRLYRGVDPWFVPPPDARARVLD